jgi:sec-independent protein translocase protein TatC
MNDPEKLPFTSHLEELRTRLIRCCIAIAIGFSVSYAFKEKLFEILTRPLIRAMAPGGKLIYTGISEAFFTFLKVSLLSGILLAVPVIVFEFWMFVAPGLYRNERKIILPIVIISTFFFLGGALFGYFVVFPFGFKYLLSFGTDTIQPFPSMKEYLSISSTMLLAFGCIFELPMVITFLARLGIVSVDFLKTNRKYAVLIFFIVAAILTPTPDVISQIMMAVPLMALYEISILGARMFGKKSVENRTTDPPTV